MVEDHKNPYTLFTKIKYVQGMIADDLPETKGKYVKIMVPSSLLRDDEFVRFCDGVRTTLPETFQVVVADERQDKDSDQSLQPEKRTLDKIMRDKISNMNDRSEKFKTGVNSLMEEVYTLALKRIR